MNNPIYKPKGKALEYAEFALNIYNGCSHLCEYCFAKKMHDRWKPNEDFSVVKVREGIVEATKKQLAKGNHKGKNILLCFMTDPYCADIDTTPTREIIQTIKDAGANFTVLTKGGMRAARDFDLYSNGDSFGTTLTVSSCTDIWEKGAASVHDRMLAIKKANEMGIKTWVSLEPIIIPADAMDFIHILHDYVDLWKVGRWNYDSRANQIDWKQVGENIEMVLKMHNCNYYIKEDLRAEMGGEIMNYWDVARKYLPSSNCLKRKYACVIVMNGHIISTGYNKSLIRCTECAREGIAHNVGDYSECKSVHAEQIALIKTRENSLQGAELYLVCDKDPDPTPCPICQRMLDFCGVKLRREKDG